MSTEHLHEPTAARHDPPRWVGEQQGEQQWDPAPALPRPWTWLGVLALMLGFMPLGLLGLWHSSSSIVSSQRGDLEAARRSSRWALVSSVAALAVSVLLVLAAVVVGVVLLARPDAGAVTVPGL